MTSINKSILFGLVICLFLTGVFLPAGSQANPWPMFGHDARNTSQSEYVGTNWGGTKWSFGVIAGATSSALGADGTVYVGSSDRNLYAINPDGSLKWTYGVTSAATSPALGTDGTVYVGSSDRNLYAINPDGSLKWKFYTNGALVPIIGADDTIYGISFDKNLYAINPDGSLKWTYPTGNGSLYPVIGVDGTIYMHSANLSTFFAINPDGTLKWSFGTSGNSWGELTPAMIGEDGTIYVGSDNNNLYAINPDGSLKWSYPTIGAVRSISVSKDDTIYFISKFSTDGSIPYRLNAISNNGVLKWTFSSFSNGYYQFTTPTIGADGTIYLGSYESSLNANNFYAINPDGSLKWSAGFPGYLIYAPRIAADGTMYVVSSEGKIYAVGIPEGIDGVYGRILDLTNSSGVSGAQITNGSSSTLTDASGYYRLELNAGMHNISISKEGYNSVTISNIEITAGKLSEISAELSSGSLNVVSTEFSSAEVGSIYNDRIKIAGGTFPYNYSIAYGILPLGLSITRSNGEITGTPSHAGAYTFAIAVSDNQGAYTEREFTLQVTEQLLIANAENRWNAMVDSAYFEQILAVGGTQPYTYSIVQGMLPLNLHMTPDGKLGDLVTNTVDFSSGVLHKNWVTMIGGISGIQTSSKKMYFSGSFYSSAATFTYDFTYGTVVTFDYETFFRSIHVLSGNFTFSVDGVQKASWGGPTSGQFSTVIGGGTHVLEWKFTNFEYNSYPTHSATIDNLSFANLDLTGEYPLVVKVTDTKGRTAEKSFVLRVDAPLAISTSNLNTGIIGSAFSQNLAASGGYGNYTWSIYSGQLPSGLSLNSSTGTISGIPVAAYYGSIILAVADQAGRIIYQDFKIQITDPLYILTSTLPAALKGAEFSETIRTQGGVGPYTFSFSGQLPAGLTLNTSNGIISGIPTIAGYTNVSITVTDSSYPVNQSHTQNLGIRVSSLLTITTSAVLPNGKYNIPINPVVFGAGGGPSPYQWNLISGYLPAGINLNAQTGQLSGNPLDYGDFIFTLRVTDANSATTDKKFFWHISKTLDLATLTARDGGIGTPYSFTYYAEGGIPPYAWHLKSGTLPTGLTLNAATGTISGTPTTGQVYSFTLEVVDSDSPAQTAEKTFQMTILDALFISNTTAPSGRLNDAYLTDFNAVMGTPPYQWSVSAGSLPPGLVLVDTTTSASLEGTPSSPGSYIFTLSVADSASPANVTTKQFTVEVLDTLVLETTTLGMAYRGVGYSETFAASGGKALYRWGITAGGLPAGLTLNSTNGILSGIPEQIYAQSSTFTVQLTDSGQTEKAVEKVFSVFVTDWVDTDGDSISDANDNCLNTYNPLQADANNNGIGDACDTASDTDGDGLTDAEEFAFGTNPLVADSDGDGLIDSLDSNPLVVNQPLVTPTPLNDNTEFVKQIYRDFLNREADAGGLAYWLNAIDTQAKTRTQVVEQYLLSAEFGQTVAPVTRLYFAYFNRIPDYGGLMYWVDQYQQGATLNQISDAFAGSGEFVATYGSLSSTDFVNLVYQNVLGRAPDAGGLAYWTGLLDASSQSRGQVMTGFSESTEYQDLMANKIYVTMVYIGLLRRAPDQGGFDYWVGVMDAGGSGIGLINGFLVSGEYAARLNSITYPTPVLQFAYPFNLLQEIEQEDETADGTYDNLTTVDYNYDGQGRYTGYQQDDDTGIDASINSTTTVTISYNTDGNPDVRIEESDWNFDATVDSRKRQTYVYDVEGHILRMIEEQDVDLDGIYDLKFTNFNSYDSSGQLTQTLRSYDADSDGIINDLTRTSYTYDASGIVQSETEELDYGNNGQLDWVKTTSYIVNAQGKATSQTVTYDTNGDTTIDRVDSVSYIYDGSNRLIQVLTQQDDGGNGSVDATHTLALSYGVGNDPASVTEEFDFDNNGTADYRALTTPSFTAAGILAIILPVSPAKPVMVPLEAQISN